MSLIIHPISNPPKYRLTCKMMELLAARRMPRTQVHRMAEMIFHMRPSDTYVKTVIDLLKHLPPVDKEGYYTVPPELAVLLSPVEAHVSAWKAEEEMAGLWMATRVQQFINDVNVGGGSGGPSNYSPPAPVLSPHTSSFLIDKGLFALDGEGFSRPGGALNDEEWFFFRCGSFLDNMAWWKAVEAVDSGAAEEKHAFSRYRRAFDMVYTSGWSKLPRTEKYRQLFDDDGKGFFDWNGMSI